jgi:glycogen debranching enzyme GlgX
MDPLTTLSEGHPWPLGATWDPKSEGTNFAVFSANASRIDLCLFDDGGTREVARFSMVAKTQHIWHGFLPHAKPGQIYAYRADGPWQPESGHRFDKTKHLLDPYAREILGDLETGYKAKVVEDDDFDWGNDRPLNTPIGSTILYEAHVKGFSQRNPLIPKALRGTYAGLASQASIEHLQNLGITAISLLPVHFALDEPRLVNLGLSNYWGYNTLGFFCATQKLASTNNPRREFREMVKALHQAGIEVILDVVFNHTAESDTGGPTCSFRGLDNARYYRLPPSDQSAFENYSGCGNTLDIRQSSVLRLVMDSLRYWASEMHVDGFRFDLAPVLGRDDNNFTVDATFFRTVAQDPVLNRVKLIAEPWDIGPGGYQVGNFPSGWLEWNDHFRDAMRGFWLHTGKPSVTRGDFAMRLCGSSDLFRGRTPNESVNYVVSHDGFTLRDVVSFEQRHNLPNGENNRDGHSNNLSINCGVEGNSDDPKVNAKRAALQRVLLAITLLSQGTPMLCAGDELGHSQAGNNNPYCQDNEITWIDWTNADRDLSAFTARVIKLRSALYPFGFFGKHWHEQLLWRQPNGLAIEGDNWHNEAEPALVCVIPSREHRNTTLLLLFNPTSAEQIFELPEGDWRLLLDTANSIASAESISSFQRNFSALPHTFVVLNQSKP